MVKIYVEHCDENLTEYDVDLAVSVGQLKDEIEETEGHSRWEQCLKFEGRELQDNQSLFSSSIRERSIVQLSANGTNDLGAIGADKGENAESVEWSEFAEIELPAGGGGEPVILEVSLPGYPKIYGGTGGSGGQGGEHGGSGGAGEGPRFRVKSEATIVRSVEPHLALYDWDGDMKHPTTNGVPLRKGMRVDVDDIITKRDGSFPLC
ncbi:hypothetical protein K438DRAFT_79391 [Mycena galopus ATCC 62051]|nr:hypothetical protein K438DRAFT_79391 [Mycena galopus ATCC 62051]